MEKFCGRKAWVSKMKSKNHTIEIGCPCRAWKIAAPPSSGCGRTPKSARSLTHLSRDEYRPEERRKKERTTYLKQSAICECNVQSCAKVPRLHHEATRTWQFAPHSQPGPRGNDGPGNPIKNEGKTQSALVCTGKTAVSGVKGFSHRIPTKRAHSTYT